MKPLAERMRPRSLKDFIGQKHLVSERSLLSRAISTDKLGSCIFFGPPGTGKTTLAGIIAETTKGEFAKMNAVSSGVADAKKLIEGYQKADILKLDIANALWINKTNTTQKLNSRRQPLKNRNVNSGGKSS